MWVNAHVAELLFINVLYVCRVGGIQPSFRVLFLPRYLVFVDVHSFHHLAEL